MLIHKKLKNILETYIHERGRLNKNSEYFFTGVKSNKPLNYKDVARVCKKLSKFIEVKFTPHTCRHTCATELLNSGMDIYKVSRILGHSSLAVTTIYLHLTTKDLQRNMDQIDLY